MVGLVQNKHLASTDSLFILISLWCLPSDLFRGVVYTKFFHARLLNLKPILNIYVTHADGCILHKYTGFVGGF